MSIPTVLEGIVTARRGHLAGIAERISHVDPHSLVPSTRSLAQSLRQRPNAFIMECKSSSPSLGLIREHYQPGAIAREYSRYAAGISVLCEPERFGGDYDHLATVAASTHLPVLCKDFIIDPVQIDAARYFGADAILLMLSILDDETYRTLAAYAHRLNLDILTEVIDEQEVHRAINLGAHIIGINHRNLHDLSIDLGRSQRLAQLIPAGTLVVAESGIRDNHTVRSLAPHAHGFLVGSQLTSQPDIELAARTLVYGNNKVCGLNSWSVAQAARAAGARYGGLIFEPSSPRHLSYEAAAEIMAQEPGLEYIAVSRRTTGWKELASSDIHGVQIHSPFQGSLAAETQLIESVRAEVGEKQIWRAVSMTTPGAAELLPELAPLVDLLVLDTGDGGTGERFDWSLIPEELKPQILLAGGIGRDTIHSALAQGCYGLDLNSGVERVRGQKDTAAIAECFAAIRAYPHQATPVSTGTVTSGPGTTVPTASGPGTAAPTASSPGTAAPAPSAITPQGAQ